MRRLAKTDVKLPTSRFTTTTHTGVAYSRGTDKREGVGGRKEGRRGGEEVRDGVKKTKNKNKTNKQKNVKEMGGGGTGFVSLR